MKYIDIAYNYKNFSYSEKIEYDFENCTKEHFNDMEDTDFDNLRLNIS